MQRFIIHSHRLGCQCGNARILFYYGDNAVPRRLYQWNQTKQELQGRKFPVDRLVVHTFTRPVADNRQSGEPVSPEHLLFTPFTNYVAVNTFIGALDGCAVESGYRVLDPNNTRNQTP